MGRSAIAPLVFNCNAPDTGNMEVLLRYGTQEQRDRWLDPLLDGRIRSAFLMTEPEVASSDATNMAATAVVDGDEVVINGRKWWSTGVGHPDCKIFVFMGLTDPEADRHHRHTMVLVPRDTPGVKVERMLPTMGYYDEPLGHGEVSLHRRPRAGRQHPVGPGRGVRDRPGPARSGAGPPLHAADRAGRGGPGAGRAGAAWSAPPSASRWPTSAATGSASPTPGSRIEQARLLVLHAAWKLDQGWSDGGALGGLADQGRRPRDGHRR